MVRQADNSIEIKLKLGGGKKKHLYGVPRQQEFVDNSGAQLSSSQIGRRTNGESSERVTDQRQNNLIHVTLNQKAADSLLATKIHKFKR